MGACVQRNAGYKVIVRVRWEDEGGELISAWIDQVY